MSIFASLAAPADDEHEETCAAWQPGGANSFALVPSFCNCGRPDAPIIYQGSHVLPSESDPRGGWVDIALIPSHITRDGRDDKPESEAPWPYLRFGVNNETVILTRRNVAQIAETLADWLARTNV